MGQPSSNHAFGELGDVGPQGDGAVAGDLLQILARLGDGDDVSAAPLLRDDSTPPRDIQQVQERLSNARAQMLQIFVAEVVWARGLLELRLRDLTDQPVRRER